ncbi:2OG-Fe(II) oxygenase [Chlorogloeopsis sp. ULAP01]|uniref:2OG-Fe(II) oxygenase n=1 Tax=Chlorogloeopsis sp. ULAP01 TaxID=3056483 RepID=UPI0025AAAF5A|nr:2OG-Fe(II) oxygenase [Chlorogloeopsis sp. ULAP01]MDM9382273.1 2OG-Fe(II) oxygenase [Chlorogloeopsis sp. ULAP01]
MYTNTMFYIEADYLNKLAIKYREAYNEVEPFPHIVIDNFLPEFILESILDEFPKVDKIDWQKFDASAEKKLASKNELQMGDTTRFLLYQLNSSVFINFLETLTGIDGLIPDPHFEGGGLHQIERGGYLKIHADFNWHRKLRLDRRLNLLLYLNQNWQEEYGGHLELWDQQMSHCVKKILPVFNRCVIFNTTDSSYHGHPEPLNSPQGQTRKSLALYYYSNGRPSTETSSPHSTMFRVRPGENQLLEKNKNSLGLAAKTTLKKLLPPILIDAGKYLKHKTRI